MVKIPIPTITLITTGLAIGIGSLFFISPSTIPQKKIPHVKQDGHTKKAKATLPIQEDAASTDKAHAVPTQKKITPDWRKKLPHLPDHLGSSYILSCEEILWDNGLLQRRSVHKKIQDESHILILEAAVGQSRLVTKFLYTADRLLLVEGSEPLSILSTKLRQHGYQVLETSPEASHAYVALSRPTDIFPNLHRIKQILGSTGQVQLEPLDTSPR